MVRPSTRWIRSDLVAGPMKLPEQLPTRGTTPQRGGTLTNEARVLAIAPVRATVIARGWRTNRQ